MAAHIFNRSISFMPSSYLLIVCLLIKDIIKVKIVLLDVLGEVHFVSIEKESECFRFSQINKFELT